MNYLQHAKATRQRIIEAGLRHARDVARREAEAAERALRRAKGARQLPPGERLVQLGEWRRDDKAPAAKECATPLCMQ